MASVGLALLALAGSGQLGNFGHVGVDQATFGPWVFFWFFAIGGLTVVMAGGVSRRPSLPTLPRRAPARATPVYDPFSDNPPDESDGPLDAFGDLPGEADDLSGEADVPDEDEPLLAEPEPDLVGQPGPDDVARPAPPPPPVKPAPDLDDVEDLMFVDADLDPDAAPPAG